MQSSNNEAGTRRPNKSTDLLRPDEAADFLDLSKKTLDNDRCTRQLGIPFVKFGRSVKYRRSDLEAFVQKRVVA